MACPTISRSQLCISRAQGLQLLSTDDTTRVAIYSAAAGGQFKQLEMLSQLPLTTLNCTAGNYILDATNLLEFLPAAWAWLVTFMALWWVSTL